MDAVHYFRESEPVLAGHLDDFLRRLGEDLGRQPWSSGGTLILGGGYGRGEGGVFRAAEGAPATLYNDLEFYLFFSGPVPDGAAAWVAKMERDGTAELGIDVEFKILPAAALQATVPTMFLFDLVAGHRFIAGDGSLLARAPQQLREPKAIPLGEVSRLLFNRGTGLLFARWQWEEKGAVESGYVERNHAKAKLALADAVLAAAGKHDVSVVERARRIKVADFPVPREWDQLRAWHEVGVEFKLRPRHRFPSASELARDAAALEQAWLGVFLWVEERRLGWPIASAPDYVESSLRIFPESGLLRNLALHARDRWRRGGALPGWGDYPRAALVRALVHLLAHGDDAKAARLLGVSASELRPAYRLWWSRYN